MGIGQIIALVVGLAAIVFIIWWFFGKHQEFVGTSTIVNDEQNATIVVNGGYSPATVVLKKVYQLKSTSICKILLLVYLTLSLNSLASIKI